MGKNTELGLVNAVTLRIWMPHKDTEGMLGSFASFLGAGHASLTVKLNGARHYITWQVAQGMPNGQVQPARNYNNNPMTKGIDEGYMTGMGWGAMNGKTRGRNTDNRKRSECDHKIRLKTLQPNEARNTATGLDANAIINWWNQRRQNETTYQLVSTTHNCTGCVTEALHAGGLGEKPRATFVVTAADVLNWVLLEGNKQGLIWG